jgi:hypothetical protein
VINRMNNLPLVPTTDLPIGLVRLSRSFG